MKQQKTWQGISTKRRNTAFFLFVFLGMLTAFGPFVTDMYLPSLPAMQGFFNTTTSMVQFGLTFSMLGLAAGQILFGPLSDRYGRKNPLLISMFLFLLATLGCIFTPNIQTFICLRFVQGIAAAGGIVISRSIATDKFKSKNLAKALAIIGAINGIAPVAAPVIGGAVLKMVSWKGIFWVLFLLGILLLLTCFHFQESLSTTRRSKEKLLKSLKLFIPLFSNKRYLFCVLQMAFALSILFAYIAASPFIIQVHYGFSQFAFSLFFAINAVAIGIGAGLSVKFKEQENCVLTSCYGMIAFSIIVFILLLLDAPIYLFEGALICLLFVMGMSFTSSSTLAMDCTRKQSGAASALLGASGFLFGSIVSPLVGLGNILVSTGIAFLLCACLALVFGLLINKTKQQAQGIN